MGASLIHPAEIGSICLLLLATLIYSVWVCAIDAKRRGRSPILVGLMTIVLFPIGLIVWVAVRPKVLVEAKGIRSISGSV